MTTPSDQDFEAFMARRLAASTAFVDGDVGPLLAVSTDRDPATIFGPPGTTVQGAAQVNAANTAGAGHFGAGGENTVQVLHSQAGEELAYWVGVQRSVVRFADRAEPTPMTLRVTEIFRRENDDWKLVHRHADALRDG